MGVLLLVLLLSLGSFVLGLFLFDRLFPAASCALALRMERRRAGLMEAEETVAGLRMPYLVGGRGEPLLLVHGFAGDKDNFTRIAGLLTPHYRVIIPDLPGFGDASRSPEISYLIADQLQRLLAFLDGLGLSRVHLGGSSMGGFIAAEFAARHPERVASLWLLDAAGTAVAHDTPLIQQALESDEFVLLPRQTRDYDQVIAATMARPPYIPHGIKLTLARRGVADHDLHRRIIDQVGKESPLLEEQFQRIDVPALIVWGASDQILNPKAAQVLQALLPHSEVEIMPGIGHLPMIEAPRATAARYLRFRKSLQK